MEIWVRHGAVIDVCTGEQAHQPSGWADRFLQQQFSVGGEG